MATSNFQTQKSFSVLLSISLTVFLLLLNKVNATESVSFSFNKFTQNNPNLLLQGDALVTRTGKLQLTKMEDCKPVVYSLGRTLYSAPIHIWDSDTGNVASFKTSFSFVINVPDKAKTTGGLAFFLAPPDTQPQKPGGLLGLFCNQNCNTAKQIVAVEFDTHSNTEWDDDQQGQHIGINVNSIKSIKTASWGFANSQEAKVDISYEASSKVLTATLVHPSSQTSHIVSSVVDLKGALPEFVRVGFSASTALSEDPFETHDILSWSFSSKLPECITVALESRCLKSSITT